MSPEETKQEAILRKVRALIAKANSTTFEGERQSFLDAADRLMEKYSIDQAMLALKDDPNAKLVGKRMMDFSWWPALATMDRDARSEIYWLWMACVKHCRCVTPGIVGYVHVGYQDDGSRKLEIPVYGTPNDLDYLDLLFTDLFLQMSLKLKPTYDPSKSMGYNVRVGKEAGMTWDQLLDWTGTRGTAEGKRLLPAYRKYLKEHPDLEQVKINPRTYQWSFVSGYCSAVKSRLRAMKEARDPQGGESTGSFAIAIRTIDEQALAAMYDDFPNLRPKPPHPADCQCQSCKDARKPVKYRSRTYDYHVAGRGSSEGQKARIASNDPKVASRNKGELT